MFDLLIGGTEHLKGSIDFVGMVTGTPSGGIVLDGSVGAMDVTLIFTATIDADSDLGMFSTNITRFPSTAASPVFSGVGTIPGAGVDVTLSSFSSSGTVILYDEPDELGPGETSDPFFLSFSSISVGDQLDMEFVVLPLGTVTVVPEAQTTALLLLGLGALVWHGRARSCRGSPHSSRRRGSSSSR